MITEEMYDAKVAKINELKKDLCLMCDFLTDDITRLNAFRRFERKYKDLGATGLGDYTNRLLEW